MIGPLGHNEFNTSAVILVGTVGDEIPAENPDVGKNVVLHRSQGGVAETLGEHTAFATMQGFVDDSVSIKGMWVRRHDRVEFGLLDIFAVRINVLEPLSSVDGDEVWSKPDEITCKLPSA